MLQLMASLSLMVVLFSKIAFGYNEEMKGLVSTKTIYGEIRKIPLLIRKASSSVHCVHLCIRNGNCGVTVFKPVSTALQYGGSCSLFDSLTENNIFVKQDGNATFKGWAFAIKKPTSCKEAYGLKIQRTSGIVDLEGMGKHYCKMNIEHCSEGGWTLAMKVDGNKDTFGYNSSYWTNAATFNGKKCLANISSNEEGKFQAFMSHPFQKICLEMGVAIDIRGMELPVKGGSLQQLFIGDGYIPTYKGRDAWKSLIYGSSLQTHCNKEGINTKLNIRVRIGIISDNSHLCRMPDSVIGVGIPFPVSFCYNKIFRVSSGNIARCSSDNGDKTISKISMIYLA